MVTCEHGRKWTRRCSECTAGLHEKLERVTRRFLGEPAVGSIASGTFEFWRNKGVIRLPNGDRADVIVTMEPTADYYWETLGTKGGAACPDKKQA